MTTLLQTYGSILDAFLASPDFGEAVISSTKAGWSGSGYSVELFDDGTWRVLWNNEIGNLYQSPGLIMSVPQLEDQDFSAAQTLKAQEELMQRIFDIEEDDLAKEMHDALHDLSVIGEQWEEVHE